MTIEKASDKIESELRSNNTPDLRASADFGANDVMEESKRASGPAVPGHRHRPRLLTSTSDFNDADSHAAVLFSSTSKSRSPRLFTSATYAFGPTSPGTQWTERTMQRTTPPRPTPVPCPALFHAAFYAQGGARTTRGSSLSAICPPSHLYLCRSIFLAHIPRTPCDGYPDLNESQYILQNVFKCLRDPCSCRLFNDPKNTETFPVFSSNEDLFSDFEQHPAHTVSLTLPIAQHPRGECVEYDRPYVALAGDAAQSVAVGLLGAQQWVEQGQETLDDAFAGGE
ncbi:hypothetical protein C8J57DRAFT_1538216 [Mycena rebaudengoi]|nr:hypothetical protein C8J57DRAFT_1538216 [Mycena rebaudengoi]